MATSACRPTPAAIQRCGSTPAARPRAAVDHHAGSRPGLGLAGGERLHRRRRLQPEHGLHGIAGLHAHPHSHAHAHAHAHPTPTPTPTPTGPSVSTSAASYTAPSGVTSITLTGSRPRRSPPTTRATPSLQQRRNHLSAGRGTTPSHRSGRRHRHRGGGTDTFVFKNIPWAGRHIIGFCGAGRHRSSDPGHLRLHGLQSDRRRPLKFASDSQGDAQIWVDLDGLPGVSGTFWSRR